MGENEMQALMNKYNHRENLLKKRNQQNMLMITLAKDN